MFTYLHLFAFVFIHSTQLLESFPHIKGSLPIIDLDTVHATIISGSPTHVLVQSVSVSKPFISPRLINLRSESQRPVPSDSDHASYQTLTLVRVVLTQPVMQRCDERGSTSAASVAPEKMADVA